MANIKFFRSANAPSNPIEGYVWFNTEDRTINLYKNSDWEKYSGIIGATYENNVLTITPAVGDPVTVSLNFASASEFETLSQNLGTLQTDFNTLSGEFTTEKDKISTLQSEMVDVKAEVTKLEGITDKVTTYVVGKIGEEETARKAADEAFEERISALETADTTLDGKIDSVESSLTGLINTEKGRIDTLVGSDSGSIRDITIDVLTETLVAEDATEAFDTLQEVSAWIKEHPEDAATMNSNISTNTTNIATNTADITEIKGQIETINTTIEENELTVASALTDLDTRLNSLASGTVSSVTGQDYITATTTDGAVVVSATTGSVENGADALALASDVKTYVDSTWV